MTGYDLFKKTLFAKLHIKLEKGKKILDVGCGDGGDCEIFIKKFHLDTYGVDIYEDKKIGKLKELRFKIGSIYKIPYKDNTFDYIFLHNVLHHIDEKKQSYKKHIQGMKELSRVTKKGGKIIIVEANRYNPLFYPHMVLLGGHNHFTQSYFKKIVTDQFVNTEFRFFECHLYPSIGKKLWEFYDVFMSRFSPKQFLAYNVAIVTK